jgi:hypothetical protein
VQGRLGEPAELAQGVAGHVAGTSVARGFDGVSMIVAARIILHG